MMKGERKLLLGAGIIGVLALVLAIRVLLFGGASGADPEPDVAPTVPESRTVADQEARSVEPAVSTREALDAPMIEPAVAAGPPASYAKSLGRVIGRVIEENGTPLPEIRVEAYSVNASVLLPTGSMIDWDPGALDFVAARSETDSEGRFELTGLEPKSVHLLGLDLGGPRASGRLLDQAPSPGETVDVGDIILGPYVTFVGQVIDEQGQPVAGARVRVTDLPSIIFASGIQDYRKGDAVLVREGGLEEVFQIPRFIANLEDKLPVPTTRTDAEGAFRIEGVPIGLVTIVVDCPEFLTLHQGPIPTGRSGEKDLGVFTLGRGTTLKGQVVDTAGHPVAGAEVMAGNRLSMADVALLHPCEPTDAQGRFEARALRPGAAYAVARRSAGEAWVVSDPVQAGSEDTVLVLPASFDLIVQVSGPEGELVEGATLKLWKAGLGNAMEFPPMFLPPVPLAGKLRTQSPGVYVIEQLAPDNYRLLASAPGYAGVESTAVVAEEVSTTEIVLDRQEEALVHVVDDATGEPVEYAQVSAWRQGEVPFFSPDASAGRTDAEGQARLGGLKKGGYKIMVSHPAYAVAGAEWELPGEPLEVALIGGGALEGRVHRAGEPPAEPMFLMLEPRGSRLPAAEIPRFTATDLEGYFRVSGLDPGEYRVQVFDRVINKGTMSLFELMQNGPLRSERVTIATGETVRLDINLAIDEALEGPAAYVKGTVLVNGQPAVDYRVVISGKKRRGVSTDQQGFFDFGRVPAGKGHLRVLGGSQEGGAFLPFGGGIIERSLDLQPGEVWQDVLRVSVGTVRGGITHADTGRPAPGATVILGSAEGRSFGGRFTATDSDGEFVFGTVPEGDYSLEVRETGYSIGSTQVSVTQGLEAPYVSLSLEVEAPVSGHLVVENPPEEGVRWAWLRFIGSDGQQQGEADVDSDSLEFTGKGMRPGTYTARVRINGERYRPVSVTIPPGGVTNLEIRCLPPAGLVSGRVILPPGTERPRGLMLVFQAGEKSEPTAWTRVDVEKLTFRVTGLEAGTYQAKAYGDGKELGPVEVVIPGGGTVEGLVIAFP